MKKNKKAETMSWILVSIAIIAIIWLGIISMVNFQNQNSKILEENFKKQILSLNIENILKSNEAWKTLDKNTKTFYINNTWENISFSDDENLKQKNFSLKNVTGNDIEKYNISIKRKINKVWEEIIEVFPEIIIEKI